MNKEKKKKDRLYGLDLLRIMAMIVVFMGHSARQYGCDYSYFMPLILLRSTAMTLFFALSGFVLYYNYSGVNLFNLKMIKNYYIKRVSGIVPTYYFVAVLYILFLGKESFIDIVKLFPIEVLGLQTTVTSLFSVSHNGGTWFVSCLLLSYFFYPYMQELLKSLTLKIKIGFLILIGGGLTYMPFLVSWYGLASIYENPFYRGCEFILGILAAGIVLECRKNFQEEGSANKKKNLLGAAMFLIPMVLFLVLLYKNIIILDRQGYEVLCYPLICSMIIGGGIINLNWIDNIKSVKTFIGYFSGIAYEFFLAQFFTWKISGYVLTGLQIDRNLFRIVFSFLICLITATILHYLFTRPISNIIKNNFIKN